ncbi:MAG TPA: DUF5667 domain-containing protein [Candidatus Doudnabacteria bacterium]|nr:DUF5667 domain-containing protein [Candidatus Doudnabacteria bacterium]
MKLSPDDILDQALARLDQGESIESIAQHFQSEELVEILKLAQTLNSIPISKAPVPTMRYSYAQKVGMWQKLVNAFQTYKLATIPLAFAMLVIGGYGTIQASEDSLPGDRLYGVKISTEQLRLKLTLDNEKKAEIHFELAKKRLSETKQVIALSNPDQEANALDALAKQTEKTFEVTSQLAAAKASQNDSSLLENLVALNKEKKTVIESAAILPDGEKLAQALNTIKETDKNLARLIAAVNEQSLLDLPNKISVTGIISGRSKSSIVVEKNDFIVNPATIMMSQDGEPITDLENLNGKIAVIGTRENNSLLAKKIIVIDPLAVLPTTNPSTASVRGATTSTPQVRPVETAEPVTPEVEETSVQKPSEATTGFIVEPAESQYPQ